MIKKHFPNNRQATLGWVLALLLLVMAVWRYGWIGLALGLGGLLFWLLMQFTRAMTVMKTAARHPKGHIKDAAALHRRLRPGISLLDLVRATRSLGVQQSPDDSQPEVYHWDDSAGVRLVCTLSQGRLVKHELTRADLT